MTSVSNFFSADEIADAVITDDEDDVSLKKGSGTYSEQDQEPMGESADGE